MQDLPAIGGWFQDADTSRFLGGPDGPAAMLADAERAVGADFRGARQPENHAARSTLEAAGFHLRSPEPACEDMLYYELGRPAFKRRRRSSPGLTPQR